MLKILFRKWLPGIAIHLILAIAVLYYYYIHGGTRWEAIPIHSFLLISCFFMLLASWAIYFRFWKKPGNLISILFLGSHVALSAWIILLHLSAATGYIILSDQVSIRAFLNYISTLPAISSQLGLNLTVLGGIASGLLILIALSWYFWLKQIRSLPEFLQSHQYSNKQLIAGLSLLTLTLFPFWGFKVLIENEWMKSLQSEPFANHFRPATSFSFSQKPSAIDFERHIQDRIAFKENLEIDIKTDDLPNIILIMIDGARADHMSLYGYHRKTTPFLDSLATTGYFTKADFATSTCTDSICGITTMLSAQFFSEIHFLNYKIHDVLHDIGYNTHFILSGDHSRAYANLQRFYGDDLTSYKDGFTETGQPTTDDEIVIRHLENDHFYDNSRPSFYYIHLMSLHFAGVKYDQHTHFTPEYQESVHSLSRIINRSDKGNLNSSTIAMLTNTYDNRMVQADDYIRRIFKILKSNGVLNNSIVAITSDHGESMGEGGWVGHGGDINLAQINIPLLFYSKNIPAINHEISYATLIDIAPSILGLLHSPIPSTWEGVDLFSRQRNQSYHMSRQRGGNNNAVLFYKNDHRYLYSMNRRIGREQLFNWDLAPYQPLDEQYMHIDEVRNTGRELYLQRFGE